jgi:hypothetical protein
LIKSSPQAPAFLDALMVQLEHDKVHHYHHHRHLFLLFLIIRESLKASMDAKNAALGDSKHATEFTLKVFAAAGPSRSPHFIH